MKIQTTAAQAWWIALADEIRPPEGLDVARTFAALKEKFEFPAIPTAPAQQGGGMDFLNGALRRGSETVLITKLAVYGDGLNTDVPSTTDNAELVLQDALDVFFSFGVRKPTTAPLHYYLSTIVADFDVSLDTLFPSSVLEKIEAAISIKGKAQFAGLNINVDKTTLPNRIGGINPSIFNIYRRLDIPYEKNRYFCQANMGTKDHIALLGEFEKLASNPK